MGRVVGLFSACQVCSISTPHSVPKRMRVWTWNSTSDGALRRPRTSQTTGAPIPHLPTGVGPVVGQPVNQVDWFRRMPTGGTVYLKPEESRQA